MNSSAFLPNELFHCLLEHCTIEIEETFNDLPYDKLPIADGMTKLKLDETDGQKTNDDENAVGHRMRLRPRKSKI